MPSDHRVVLKKEESSSSSSTTKKAASAKLDSLFCPDCGSLFPLPTESGNVICDICGFKRGHEELAAQVVVTRSKMIRAYKAEKDKTEDDESHGATINEECPQCGYNEMYFTTAQLRSADEGQTVFYECISCGFKFSVNT
eukprot:TRINITY_DN7280_c0_g1_i1.p2 TRINITY_DN7280_c0_g1~~TRINITY_DN7280_c0_g1_i1.p2  ORF type:complete len:140 (+),score=38.94 TRINITY_DN7280_c0_g1_i1:119-538(+)